jgi:hypothetical protein
MRANGRRAWQIGQRVIRQDSGERGTVVENNGPIKVKWDGGRTSSFRHGQAANVQLETTRANYQFWPAARPGMRVVSSQRFVSSNVSVILLRRGGRSGLKSAGARGLPDHPIGEIEHGDRVGGGIILGQPGQRALRSAA